MSEHSVFYYPYATLNADQLPLLKAAALYFDRLLVLDPSRASWVTIAGDDDGRRAAAALLDAGILAPLDPVEELPRIEQRLVQSMEEDLADERFLELCRPRESRWWTLSLEKVPAELRDDPRFAPRDAAMRRLMTSAGRASGLAGATGEYREVYASYREVRGQGAQDVYDEYVDGAEYRYVDVPFAVGESLMLNHALLLGLGYGAVPITDDPVHRAVLDLKLARLAGDARTQEAITKRRDMLSASRAAADLITDERLDLPALRQDVDIEVLLDFRSSSEGEALEAVRRRMALLAAQLDSEPWDAAFEREVGRRLLPQVADQMDAFTEAVRSWQKQKKRRILHGVGAAAGVAGAALTMAVAPPLALAAGALGLVQAAQPGAELLMSRGEGEPDLRRGLNYLFAAGGS
jgi:hypothetical protein